MASTPSSTRDNNRLDSSISGGSSLETPVRIGQIASDLIDSDSLDRLDRMTDVSRARQLGDGETAMPSEPGRVGQVSSK